MRFDRCDEDFHRIVVDEIICTGNTDFTNTFLL